MHINKNKKIERYIEGKGIRFIVLFGSKVNGLSNKESNFDISVSLENGKSIFDDTKTYS